MPKKPVYNLAKRLIRKLRVGEVLTDKTLRWYRDTVCRYEECDTGEGTAVVTLTNSTPSDLLEVEVEGATNIPLTDLEVVVVDENENEILSIDYPAYTNNELNLTILAQCTVILGQNTNVIVSNTEPVPASEGMIWFEPI